MANQYFYVRGGVRPQNARQRAVRETPRGRAPARRSRRSARLARPRESPLGDAAELAALAADAVAEDADGAVPLCAPAASRAASASPSDAGDETAQLKAAVKERVEADNRRRASDFEQAHGAVSATLCRGEGRQRTPALGSREHRMAYYRSKLRLSLAHGGGADDATGGAGATIDVAGRGYTSLRRAARPPPPGRRFTRRRSCRRPSTPIRR